MVFINMYAILTCSLKDVPNKFWQQQQAILQNDEPAQQMASVAIDKHILSFKFIL